MIKKVKGMIVGLGNDYRRDDAVKASSAEENIDLWKGFNKICAVALGEAACHNEPPAVGLLFPFSHFQDDVDRFVDSRLDKTACIHHYTVCP